jgi:hypothetical protein
MNSYIKQFVLIIIACIIGALLAAQFVTEAPVPNSFWVCFAFISLASLAVHRILTEASRKRPQIFVAYFMGALTAKILLSGILLVIAGLVDREGLKFTAIGFLIAYVLLTVLEIRHLLPLMKNEKSE